MTRKTKPNFLVSDEEFSALRDHKSRVYRVPLEKKHIDFLPRAIEINELTLVFPVQLCPKSVTFRTRKDKCQREVLNIMAHKEEDGSEILIVRLK